MTYLGCDTLDHLCELKFNATAVLPETKELLVSGAKSKDGSCGFLLSYKSAFLLYQQDQHLQNRVPEKMKIAFNSDNALVLLPTNMFMLVWKRCVCVCVVVVVGGIEGDVGGSIAEVRKCSNYSRGSVSDL